MGTEPIEIDAVAPRPAETPADVVAFLVLDPPALGEAGAQLDEALGGRLGRLLDDGELKGTPGRVTVLHTLGEIPARRVLAAGAGKADALDADVVRTAAARVAVRAAGSGGGAVAWVIDERLRIPAEEQARAIVEGTVLGSFDPGVWKTDDDRPTPPRRLLLLTSAPDAVAAAARRAATVSAWATTCRVLGNTPANLLTPERLAGHAAEIAERHEHVSFEALGRDEIAAAGMGAFAAVAQGSDAEPRLIVLRYAPPGARDGLVLGLVGKAITFDTGGYSLKPPAKMDEMKTDMAGGAAAICGLAAVAELGLPLEIIAVVPSCENMVSGRAMRPGDVVTASNGKTIEITNTDAEGRLVLADALVDARRRGATHVLDLATLTGAVVVALGDFYAGLMGSDDAWVGEVLAAAKASGDHAWRLPLHDTQKRYFQSTYADLKNSSDLRQAGPLYAGRFLQEFAGDGPWAHLDIAGTADLERSRGDYLTQRGATGYGVRLIAELAARCALDG